MKSILACTLIILSTSLAYADAYTGKEDVKPDGKATITRQHNIPGRLYPFKTHNNGWDNLPRPQYWNGYGVDPSEANYWNYYNDKTECYPGYDSVWQGTNHCATENDPENIKEIPEPSKLLMLAAGILIGLLIGRD